MSSLFVGLSILMMGAAEIRVETPHSTLMFSYEPSEETFPLIRVDGAQIAEINHVALRQAKHRHFEFVASEGSHTLSITGPGLNAVTTRFQVDPGTKHTVRVSLSPLRATVPFDQGLAQALQTEWEQYLGDVAVNSLDMPLRLIPAGEFPMGTTPEEITEFTQNESNEYWVKYCKSEGPRHRVVISRPFMLGAYEVTRREFREFIEATDYKTDAERDGKGGYSWRPWGQSPDVTWDNIPGLPQTDVGPVVNVSWNDAVAFCQWLSKVEGQTYRLPTEAEWEFACRGGSAGKWSFAQDEESLLETHSIYGYRDGRGTQSVGQKLPNAFGLFDMHGNVYEWCHDWYDENYYQHVASHRSPRAGHGGVSRDARWLVSRNSQEPALRQPQRSRIDRPDAVCRFPRRA